MKYESRVDFRKIISRLHDSTLKESLEIKEKIS